MPAKITRDVLESYLNCKFKGYLKLIGQQGTKCDYQTMLAEMRAEVRLAAIDKILARHPGEEIPRNIPLTIAALRQGPSYILDATLEDDLFSLHFDGMKKVEGPSKLGDFYYLPMLFHEGEKIPTGQKLLLDVYGLMLSRLQGCSPSNGIIWHGKDCRATRARLSPDNRQAGKLLRSLSDLTSSEAGQKLHLIDHCQICEFRKRCQEQAVKEDSLSLLHGISVNEVARQNRKGIFTVTQLSYTFRIRRQRKRVKQPSTPHHFALQALAIREKKVFVHGSPALPTNLPRVYVDIEGDPERASYYLIGAIAVVEGVEVQQSYWANDATEEVTIFCRFLDFLGSLPDYTLLHFGSYEVTALRRMKLLLPVSYQPKADDAIRRSINVLSIISPFIYFPTYSNGLKDLGHYLGHAWSAPSASGIQSIVWRRQWMKCRDESLQRMLIQYNLEDCVALKKVAGAIDEIITQGQTEVQGSNESTPPVVFTKSLPKSEGHKHVFKKAVFALSDFEFINNCAYFDYQRDRVFARSHAVIRRANKAKRKPKTRSVRLNKVVELSATRCQVCRSRKIEQGRQVRRLIIDLKFYRNGVKRWVVRYLSWSYHCSKCGNEFIPHGFPERTTKYGHSLVTWCIYQNIVCGQNMLQIKRGLLDLFGLRFPQPQLYRFKIAVAQFYQARYEEILKEILRGPVLHIDETEVDLRGKKGYVWVITSIDAVYYFFKDSREGSFLKEFLKDFKGVLVSDFYTAYDSLDMPQQRCLIHLMRDLNDDLLKNPFNEEFKELSSRFSALLKSIVDIIDRYGLKKRHLHKHQPAVKRFFDYLAASEFATELAQKYQKRLQKYDRLLFAFLDYDDVPWNNNNAEHAIKVFARYRRFADGRFSDLSIRDYLVILSVYQTCEYRGIDFLQFLLVEERERGMNFGSGKRVVVVGAAGGDGDSSEGDTAEATIETQKQQP